MNNGNNHSQKLEILGQLSAAILHDLQSPVTFIDSNNRYLIKKIRKKLDSPELADEIFDVLKENEEGLVQIKELLSNIKQFLKNESHPKLVSLSNLLKICRKIVLPQAQSRIKLTLNTLEDDILVSVIPSQFKQVIINLLVNAIEAFDENSQNPEILINYYTKANQIYIKVRDNGCGIPEDKLISIFEWYTSTKTQGTGQGLAISKQIIEGHQGNISCESQLDSGTLFSITLPLGDENE